MILGEIPLCQFRHLKIDIHPNILFLPFVAEDSFAKLLLSI